MSSDLKRQSNSKRFLQPHPQKGEPVDIQDSDRKIVSKSLHSEISCEKLLISPDSPACNPQPEIQFGVEHLFLQQSLLMEDEHSDVRVALRRVNTHSISWRKWASIIDRPPNAISIMTGVLFPSDFQLGRVFWTHLQFISPRLNSTVIVWELQPRQAMMSGRQEVTSLPGWNPGCGYSSLAPPSRYQMGHYRAFAVFPGGVTVILLLLCFCWQTPTNYLVMFDYL